MKERVWAAASIFSEACCLYCDGRLVCRMGPAGPYWHCLCKEKGQKNGLEDTRGKTKP